MKYIMCSILLLSILLTFCFLSACYVSRHVSIAAEYLQLAISLHRTGEFQHAAAQVTHASQAWNHSQNYFGIVLTHDVIDDVQTDFARLLAYSLTEDKDDFISNCEALLANLKHIKEMEWPFAYNIL